MPNTFQRGRLPSFLLTSFIPKPLRGHVVNARPRYLCQQTQPRAQIQTADEADWIVVDVALRGLDETAQPLANDLKRDGRALVKRALHNQPAELSLVLCSDIEILKLNKNWRNKEKPTDVLSFPQNDEVVLGDVVISVDTAKRQAQERKLDLQVELRVLLVHGLLHLMGYDHEKSATELEIMANAEQRLMEDLGWLGEGLISSARDKALLERIHHTQRA